MLAVIQARMSSTRLPGKVLHDLGGRPILEWVVEAALSSQAFDRVVIATTDQQEDEPIVDLCNKFPISYVRGPTQDVLSRFILAVNEFGPQPVTRLTADCPLLDPSILRAAVNLFDSLPASYVSTIEPRTLPHGLDVEVVSEEALLAADEWAQGADRVHVTSYLRARPGEFPRIGLVFEPKATDLRLTVDEPDDLSLLQAVVAELGSEATDFRRLISFLRTRPDLQAINAYVRQKSIGEG